MSEDLQEQAARAELLNMTRTELDLVDYTELKWLCSGKGCSNGTTVRDYGLHLFTITRAKALAFIICARGFGCAPNITRCLSGCDLNLTFSKSPAIFSTSTNRNLNK